VFACRVFEARRCSARARRHTPERRAVRLTHRAVAAESSVRLFWATGPARGRPAACTDSTGRHRPRPGSPGRPRYQVPRRMAGESAASKHAPGRIGADSDEWPSNMQMEPTRAMVSSRRAAHLQRSTDAEA